MHRLLAVVALVAGCAGAGGPSPTAGSDDPLALAETPLAVEILPGQLTGAWPAPFARGAHAWLLPFADGDGVHVRLVGDDGTRADRFVDRGTLVGAAALDDGFAVAVATASAARVHFLSDDGSDLVVSAPLAGAPVTGIASDGARVLLAATEGGAIAVEQPRPLTATLALIARDGARAIDLGAVAAAPTPWGDARGFIVAGALLVDGNGRTAPAPGRQVRDARIFRKPIAAGTLPTSDTISLDGAAWLSVDGLVAWAGRDRAVARLEVVTGRGRALVEVGDDLTPRSQRALPATALGDGGQSWIAAAAGSHVVWGATLANDPVFAIFDAAAMRADGGLVRIRNGTSRATIVSPGESGVLFSWTGDGGSVHFAVHPW